MTDNRVATLAIHSERLDRPLRDPADPEQVLLGGSHLVAPYRTGSTTADDQFYTVTAAFQWP